MRRRIPILCVLALTLAGLWMPTRHSIFSRPQESPCGSSPCAEGVSQTAPRQLQFPYYSLRDGFESTLLLVSASPKPIDLFIAVRSSSGQTLLAPMVTIQPQEKLTIDLRTLLGNLGADVVGTFAEGSVAVYFEGTIMPVAGQLTLTNPERRLILESEMVDNSPGLGILPASLNAVWWGLGGGREAKFMVTNTASSAVTADVFVDIRGERRAIAPLAFAPFETKVLSVSQLLSDLNLSPAQAPEGGITIVARGTPPSLVAQGRVTDGATGFSATLNFPDPALQRASVLHASGLPIGTPSERSPYAGLGSFVPHVVVRNLTSAPQSVTISVEYAGESGPEQTVLAPVLLEGYATKDISFDTAFGLLPLPLPFCSIRIQYNGPPGSVMAEVASIELKGDLVIDGRLANEGDGWAGSGANPWHLDAETESILFLTNMGDRDCRIGFRVDALGTPYFLTDLRLKPQETRAIDLRKLRDQQKTDFQGNLIPAQATDGSVLWIVLDKVAVMGRLVVLERHRGLASSYQCEICDGGCPPSYTGLSVSPTVSSLLPGSTGQCTATAKYTDCNGSNTYSTVTTVASWTSNNTAVATVNNSTSKGLVTGVAGGTANITATYTDATHTWQVTYCLNSSATYSNSGTCNVTKLTCGTAAGSQSAVTRGGTAYCSLSNVPSGATTSSWKFTDGTNTVTPATNPGTSWSGVAVTGGTVSVTVTSGSNSKTLSATLTVNARTGFTFSAVSPQKVANGQPTGGCVGIGSIEIAPARLPRLGSELPFPKQELDAQYRLRRPEWELQVHHLALEHYDLSMAQVAGPRQHRKRVLFEADRNLQCQHEPDWMYKWLQPCHTDAET